MFGLWYLSLAIDELRKFLGWSSIFDVFKTDTKTSNKAIEDKKPSNSATINNKNEVPQPKPITKPAPEPPKPAVVEPPKPKLEPTKPAPEPPKPVVQPSKPAPEPPKPITTPPKSSSPPKPVLEPLKPSASPTVTPPKSSSPPKVTTPTKQVTPPVTPPSVELPKKEPSPPQPKPSPSPSLVSDRNNSNNIDRNVFTPPKKLENGDSSGNDLKSNIKDATTSFLQEEGAGKQGLQGLNKQQNPSVQSSNIDFKQL